MIQFLKGPVSSTYVSNLTLLFDFEHAGRGITDHKSYVAHCSELIQEIESLNWKLSLQQEGPLLTGYAWNTYYPAGFPDTAKAVRKTIPSFSVDVEEQPNVLLRLLQVILDEIHHPRSEDQAPLGIWDARNTRHLAAPQKVVHRSDS